MRIRSPRLAQTRPLIAFGAAVFLSGCAETPPPAPPMLVAEPGPNKTAQAFAQDDVICRQADPASPVKASTASAYLQCMASRGNLLTPESTPPTAVTYLAYPTAFPWPFFDWGWWWTSGWGGPGPGAGPHPAGGPGPDSGPLPPDGR